MARQDEFKSGGSNPAKYFLEWKSEEKQFSFYDKEKAQNIFVPLPFKFLVLKQMNAVKGWHDKSESGIYSNEVAKVSEESLTVKAFKGGVIAEGLYKDIKQIVNDAGGHYVKSIYVMTEKGELVNIQLKGSSVQAWSEFTQKTLSRLGDEWVLVTEASEHQKGKVKYYVPVFTFAGSITKEQGAIADVKYEEILSHVKGSKSNIEAEIVASVAEEDDDLPF